MHVNSTVKLTWRKDLESNPAGFWAQIVLVLSERLRSYFIQPQPDTRIWPFHQNNRSEYQVKPGDFGNENQNWSRFLLIWIKLKQKNANTLLKDSEHVRWPVCQQAVSFTTCKKASLPLKMWKFDNYRTLTFRTHWVNASLHVTSRRPCWWSRTKAFLSSGN